MWGQPLRVDDSHSSDFDTNSSFLGLEYQNPALVNVSKLLEKGKEGLTSCSTSSYKADGLSLVW